MAYSGDSSLRRPGAAGSGNTVSAALVVVGAALAAALMGAGIVLLNPALTMMLAALLALCSYIIFDFRVGVVLTSLIIPLYETSFFPHQMFGITGANPFNLLILATTASYLLRRMKREAPYRLIPKRMLWLYLVPIGLASLHGAMHVHEIPFAALAAKDILFFTDIPGYLRDNLIRPLMLVLYALLLAAAIRDSKRPALFLIPYLLSIWMLAGLMVVTAILRTGGNPAAIATDRQLLTESMGMHANELGLFFNISYAVLLFSLGKVRGKLARLAYIASIGMVVAATLMTFSRGAFVGTAVVTVLFLLSRRKFYVIVIGVVLLGASVPLLPEAIRERALVGIEDRNVNVIAAGRTDKIWLPLLDFALEDPVLGHGLAATLWSEPMKKDPTFDVGHAHNAYLNTFLDMGAVGLVILLGFFILQLREFRQLGRDASIAPLLQGVFQGAAVAVIVLFVQGMTDDRLTPTASQISLWFVIGMSIGMSERLLRARRSDAKREQ
ncbi:O-antigen ligase family protein [Noviherbaspirillum pedocola]|uniref:O-antigen ligase family protein n=1 Tax=Noviherbaspirillum pedocola TaxID=2801341 RepID=A0A934SYT0_9BURK|nr:O-antigen ligase family protein [Noviherbaspirillum pedocola]MBK4739035.1 O-antigen ligase family protein [Noviherbaspirillum pedocola]